MLRCGLFWLLFTNLFVISAQSNNSNDSQKPSFFEAQDSLQKGRLIGVTSGIGSTSIGSMIGLGTVWYENLGKTKFHTFDDSHNWLQMDKSGHVYAAYQLNRLTSDLYAWSGISRKKSAWIGLGVSMGYQTTLEVLDGFSSDWGWSWSDIAANAFGSGLYTAQEFLWNEQRILPKFSYSPTPYASIRPAVLGSTFTEALLKDYNGQTYWLSFSLGTFLKSSKFPEWACISFGYSAHEKLVGDQNLYLDPATGIEYHAQREFLLSLDIDFSKLPIRRPWLKVLVKQLNYLKIPFPTLILRDGTLQARPLYF